MESTKNKQFDTTDLEQKVKSMYRDVALHPEKEYHFSIGRKLAENLGYLLIDLERIPTAAVESFAGVGYFFDLAAIKEGETVLDLGSGSGTDVFIAALRTGKTGQVWGVDMTEEQLDKAERLRKETGFENVSFYKGYIEQLPFPNQSVDVVISNGVINLSAQKEQVFAEAARVLKPGGRMAIADIISEKQLPAAVVSNTTFWASCIGGASQKDQYRSAIENNGFQLAQIRNNPPYHFLSQSAKGASQQFGVKSISLLAIKKRNS
ncbi:methyltransferase domain-containing protein [Chitinophagaceae bacterium LB-8]|uniref:Arsenite methyltransferase n=1 Tax=Paraflavisolibacter caeni TaxID=2982496 RepID=A0A9X2XW48_9BACT|nr:methyltransferase domain-containing protein [Paraflavisolibacter caeni]MCU7550489.1 methyltransferase domain-containing protein [Paraflavisolibacter caeni]